MRIPGIYIKVTGFAKADAVLHSSKSLHHLIAPFRLVAKKLLW